MGRRYDLEDPAVTARKQERLAQSARRLEQKDLHMQIQQQKIELTKQKRAQEKREKLIRKIKKILSLYYVMKTVKVVSALVLALSGLLFALRQLANEDPNARELYFGLISKLDLLLQKIKKGMTVDKSEVENILNKALYAVRLPLSKGKELFVKLMNKSHKDSNMFNKKILDRMILDEWHSRLTMAYGKKYPKHFADAKTKMNPSVYRRYKREAMRRVDMAIVRHDKRYNDIVGPSLAIVILKTVILPILKAGAIAGVGAAVSAPLKKATEPIIGGLIDNIKRVAKAKPEDQTYIEAICRDIKFQFEKLLAILKREGNYLYSKLMIPWQKVKALI